jgi:GDP/UDP-N,N'-diacetylbacillosamine 2-epimerase (hydrolysing)
MVDMPNKVFNVGAMSLDNIKHVKRYSINEFKKLWNIDLSIPTILVTFHPETVESSLDLNKYFANQIANTLLTQKHYQIVITMPNADAAGTVIRDVFEEKLNGKKNIILVENFGTRGYFTIMEKCEFLIGNTSSGIIEAASFGKYVIDLGNRQKGRVINKNVLKVAINSSSINSAIEKVKKFPRYSEKNIYWNGGSAEKIIKIIEKHI